MNIINLTPHSITLVAEDGTKTEFAPSGIIARVAQIREQVGTLDGFPLYRNTFGEVVGLPEAVADTVFIVSALVAQAAKDRDDLIIVDNTIRDENGRIIGARGFARVKED